MDFHGHINLQNNEMRKMAFDAETDFPASPVVGRMVFKNFTLYMCVDLNGILPIWVPVTNTINMYTHTQSTAATTWNIKHSLAGLNPVVQVYDSTDKLIIPQSVVATDSLNLTITFNTAITGKAVILKGDEIPTDGIGVLSPTRVAYTQDFTSATTIVVLHQLGYYPIVRAYVGGNEILPQSVIHDSIYQVTVTFSSAQTGTLRLA